ncbi:MAG TPA: ATP-binding protein [Phycisphaerae bacterium]|jgi:signal transduction histidine kinase|nr:sensor histidine kinase [Phycisphaerae bacterium]HOB76235.1 ATP-binding protein [Phycisphaerae bacterium]HOJ56209.1 ATP-binding protein [Phycisphaerae bacterium]HOL28065.1 ATP-binding protein [Phycisphaerae bacterium]HPP22423.1 ATP-binding protein [Phycisphaerae bacterium]
MNHASAQNADLRERVKELTCLYSLAQLVERSGISLAEILQGAVELLPPAWQYPERAAGRIVFEGRSYVTANFREGCQMQSTPILVNGQPKGRIDVVYLEEMPPACEGPFLKEERHLIDTMARQIALIVERRQAEEDQLRLQKQLRHADRLATIGQLAAGVAHELNEPLGNILGFAQLAQKHPDLPSEVGQDLAKIVATCLHARQIIHSLLLFSRQMPPQKARLNLNGVVEEALALLEQRCSKNDIILVRRLAGDLPEITADASQLRQVVVDLAVNAVHAMPQGGVLEVATRAAGDRVILSVQDNGVGMSEEVLREIFVPFFTTKDVNEGTGLGLPVVHGIVTSHGGTIRVQSTPGQGARFDVELPVDAGERTNGERKNGRDE